MTDDNDVYTPAQYREHQEGYGVRDPDAAESAGVIRDPLASRYAAVTAAYYDVRETGNPARMPSTAQDLTEIQNLRTLEGTETAREALANGDMPTLKHLTGDQQERADISGIKAIQQIDQIIESPAPVIVILGEMGTGKTDLACLIAQRAKHLLGVDKTASNIPTLKETDKWCPEPGHDVVDAEVVGPDGQPVDGEVRDGFAPNFRALEAWVEQDGDPMGDHHQRQKLFIGDEFSSVGDGSGKSGYLMRKKMGPLVFKIRKYNGLLVYIAHDPSSIHPLLWRLGVIIYKKSKKQAVVADKITNGEVRQERFKVDGIPRTDWRYDTNDPAVWSWTGAEDGEEEQPEPGSVAWDCCCYFAIKTGEEADLSTRDAADTMPFEYRWIAERRREFEEEGDHRDLMHKVEAWTE